MSDSPPIPTDRTTPTGALLGWKLAVTCAALWAAVEVMLLAFRPGYPFTLIGLLDTWFYTSFQWDLPRQMEEFGNTYYSARMSLFLPGTLLHALLPPAAATIAYKLLFSAGTTWAWAFLALRAAGPRAALLTAAVGPLLPWFIVARHNDYMDIGVLLYGSLAAGFIAGAVGARRPVLWRIAAGFSFGSMLIANLSAAASLGLGLIVFYFVQHRESWARRIRSGVEIALGAGLATLLFGLASRLAGGPSWVLGPQIEALLQIGGMAKNPWAPENSSWLLIATWLVVPVSALGFGLQLLLSPDIRRESRFRTLRALLAGHTVALGGALLMELKGMGVLYHWFYVLFHFALGAPLLFASICVAGSATAAHRALLGVPLLAAILVGGDISMWLAGLQPRLGITTALGTLSTVSAIVVLLVGLMLPRRFLGAREVILALLVLCSTPTFFNNVPPDERLRDRYLLVHQTFHEINQLFGTNRYRIWIDGDFFDDGRAVSSSKLYGFRLLTEKRFPEVERERSTDLPLIVPTRPGAAAARFAVAKAAHPNAKFSEPTIHEIRSPSGLGLDLLVFTMREQTIDPEAPGAHPGPFHLLMDWKNDGGSSYASRLAAMIYKPTAEPAVQDGSTHPTFKRTTSDDHLATPFLPLPAGKNRDAFVVLELAEPAEGVFVLQTESYQNLGLFTLGKSGRVIQRFSLSDQTQSVRIYFQSLTEQRIALPHRVALFVTTNP